MRRPVPEKSQSRFPTRRRWKSGCPAPGRKIRMRIAWRRQHLPFQSPIVSWSPAAGWRRNRNAHTAGRCQLSASLSQRAPVRLRSGIVWQPYAQRRGCRRNGRNGWVFSKRPPAVPASRAPPAPRFAPHGQVAAVDQRGLLRPRNRILEDSQPRSSTRMVGGNCRASWLPA